MISWLFDNLNSPYNLKTNQISKKQKEIYWERNVESI